MDYSGWLGGCRHSVSFNFAGAQQPFIRFHLCAVRVPIIVECGLCDFNRAVLICVKAKALRRPLHTPMTPLPPSHSLFLLKAFLDDSEYCTLAYCLAHGRFFPSGAPSFAISILPLIKINDDCKNHQRYNVPVELIWMRFPAQGTFIGKSHLCFVPAR